MAKSLVELEIISGDELSDSDQEHLKCLRYDKIVVSSEKIVENPYFENNINNSISPSLPQSDTTAVDNSDNKFSDCSTDNDVGNSKFCNKASRDDNLEGNNSHLGDKVIEERDSHKDLNNLLLPLLPELDTARVDNLDNNFSDNSTDKDLHNTVCSEKVVINNDLELNNTVKRDNVVESLIVEGDLDHSLLPSFPQPESMSIDDLESIFSDRYSDKDVLYSEYCRKEIIGPPVIPIRYNKGYHNNSYNGQNFGNGNNYSRNSRDYNRSNEFRQENRHRMPYKTKSDYDGSNIPAKISKQ